MEISKQSDLASPLSPTSHAVLIVDQGETTFDKGSYRIVLLLVRVNAYIVLVLVLLDTSVTHNPS